MPVCILDTIHGHRDLAGLNAAQRQQLCGELRQFLVEHVSKTGGHVASNLGVVELTVAIETVYNTQKDRLLFDVGHQSYIHKILNGRRQAFDGLRQYGGIAGFPKPSESETDAFVAGHASSSVSIALGIARARTLSGSDYDVIAVLGDGAATGGMAYEGLNDAGVSGEPIVVILNDNQLSIDRNVGGMATHLRNLRAKEKYLGMKRRYRSFLTKLPGGRAVYLFTHKIKGWFRRVLIPTTIFDNMGFTYLGPVDGHDTEELIELLQKAKAMACPVLLHVVTQKGKGYPHSEEHPKLFHGIGKFDPITGEPEKKNNSSTFSDVFGETMLELAAVDSRICAITAAMPGGTGLLDFKKQHPKRLFDVGIAEEHAVSMAGGLAKQGMVPVVALYSTFLQRAYDMILQDVCMLNLHVVFAIDRAGLVGEDGETHHGVFDFGFLRQAPGMQVLCPASGKELRDMLLWAAEDCTGPVAVRYPRGGDRGYTDSAWNGVNPVSCHRQGKDVTILTYGTLLANAMEAAELLAKQGIEATVLRLMRVHPLPVREICKMMPKTSHLFVLEETMANCGICGTLTAALQKDDIRVTGMDLGSNYVPHGSCDVLYRHCGLDAQSVMKKILEVHSHEK